MRFLKATTSALALLILYSGTAAADEKFDFKCDAGEVCRYDDTQLPVRVLTRPTASIFDAPGSDAKILKSNLPPFRPWYVYEAEDVDYSDAENPAGFFQVAVARDSDPVGWIAAGDAMLWRSAIVVTYTPRGAGEEEDKRSRVLMFSSLDKLKELTADEDPSARIAGAISAIEAGNLDELAAMDVISAEPKRFVDHQHGFYALPVVDFEKYAVGVDKQALYLRIAAAVPATEESTGRGATVLTNAEVRENVEETDVASLTTLQQAKDLEVDIKFVIDMTGSMQPYLNATQDAVGRLIFEIEEIGLPKDAVNYGLIGYTDEPSQCGACSFNYAKNFTPQLASSEEIRNILSNDPSARGVAGKDWPETVYAGVSEAITSQWSENAIKVVVLIGDAFSKEIDANGGTLTADSVRSLANDASGTGSVTVLSLHARPSGIKDSDNRTAEEQFRTLATNPGSQSAGYIGFDVNPKQPEDIENRFLEGIREVGETLLPIISAVRSGDKDILEEITEGGDDPSAGSGSIAEVVKDAIAPQLIEYLGTEAVRPNDMTAWVTDVDPADSYLEALDVRVLLEKRDLEDLIKTMEALLVGYANADLLGKDFFQEMQAAALGTALDEGGRSEDAKKLASSSLGPSWLASLPYQSAIMSLDETTFTNLTVDQREEFQKGIEDSLSTLKSYFNTPEVWQKLSPDVGELSSVFPVPLNDLP